MGQTLVSVITVVFNGRAEIEKTLNSVLAQGGHDFELIIVDGGSSDGTVEIIKQHEGPNVTVICERDRGIYDAMNKGVHRACGEWAIFINSGDELARPDILDVVRPHLAGGVDFVYGDTEVLYGNGRVRYVKARMPATPRVMPTCHQSMFFRTDWLRTHPYDLRFSIAADFDAVSRIFASGKKLARISVPISRVTAGGLSDRRRLEVYAQYEEIYGRYSKRTLRARCFYWRRRWIERCKSPVKFLVNRILKVS